MYSLFPSLYLEMSSENSPQKPAPALLKRGESDLSKNVEYMDDELLLASLGYKQDLSRQLSMFSNFALSFGCCSVLSGLLPVGKRAYDYSLNIYKIPSVDVGHSFTNRRNFSYYLGLSSRCYTHFNDRIQLSRK